MQWVLYNPLPTLKLSFNQLYPHISKELSDFQDQINVGTEDIIHHDKIILRDVPSSPAYRNNVYYSFNSNSRYFEMSPLLPLGMLLIISTVIFVLVIFRRWPGLVAGIIAGALTSVTIYLTLLALKEQKLVYE